MVTAKLYPIKQVELDLYDQNAKLAEQIGALSALEKIPSVSHKSPAWLSVSDPITTLLFTKVLTGRLPAIGPTGHKVAMPTSPRQFDNLHVTESEANDVLHEAGYRFIWKPKVRKTKTKSVAVNWKHTYQAEATDYYLRTWRSGAQPTRTDCAKYLHGWGTRTNTKTDTGIVPAITTIRNYVLGSQYWSPPKKPNP